MSVWLRGPAGQLCTAWPGSRPRGLDFPWTVSSPYLESPDCPRTGPDTVAPNAETVRVRSNGEWTLSMLAAAGYVRGLRGA